jgi:hypothetical protein
MGKYETTINTLEQLNRKIYKEHWDDIRVLEDEDNRYTIALNNAEHSLELLDKLIEGCIADIEWYQEHGNNEDLRRGIIGANRKILNLLRVDGYY